MRCKNTFAVERDFKGKICGPFVAGPCRGDVLTITGDAVNSCSDPFTSHQLALGYECDESRALLLFDLLASRDQRTRLLSTCTLITPQFRVDRGARLSLLEVT